MLANLQGGCEATDLLESIQVLKESAINPPDEVLIFSEGAACTETSKMLANLLLSNNASKRNELVDALFDDKKSKDMLMKRNLAPLYVDVGMGIYLHLEM